MKPTLSQWQNQTKTSQEKEERKKNKKEKKHPQAIFFRIIYAKTFKKILANQSQQHIKRIICHEQMRFVPKLKGWFNHQKSINVIHHIDGLKDRNHRSFQ